MNMIEVFKNEVNEFVDYFTCLNDEYNGMEREIKIWRKRFLTALPKEKTIEIGAEIWTKFLWNLTAEELLNFSPEECIEKIRKQVIDENR